MNIYQMYEYCVCVFIFKCLAREYPQIFCNYFKRNINARTSSNQVYIIRKLVKSSETIHTFKKLLRNYIFNVNDV